MRLRGIIGPLLLRRLLTPKLVAWRGTIVPERWSQSRDESWLGRGQRVASAIPEGLPAPLSPPAPRQRGPPGDVVFHLVLPRTTLLLVLVLPRKHLLVERPAVRVLALRRGRPATPVYPFSVQQAIVFYRLMFVWEQLLFRLLLPVLWLLSLLLEMIRRRLGVVHQQGGRVDRGLRCGDREDHPRVERRRIGERPLEVVALTPPFPRRRLVIDGPEWRPGDVLSGRVVAGRRQQRRSPAPRMIPPCHARDKPRNVTWIQYMVPPARCPTIAPLEKYMRASAAPVPQFLLACPDVELDRLGSLGAYLSSQWRASISGCCSFGEEDRPAHIPPDGSRTTISLRGRLRGGKAASLLGQT